MIINMDIQNTQAIIIYSYLFFQADIHPFFGQPFPLTGDALFQTEAVQLPPRRLRWIFPWILRCPKEGADFPSLCEMHHLVCIFIYSNIVILLHIYIYKCMYSILNISTFPIETYHALCTGKSYRTELFHAPFFNILSLTRMLPIKWRTFYLWVINHLVT